MAYGINDISSRHLFRGRSPLTKVTWSLLTCRPSLTLSVSLRLLKLNHEEGREGSPALGLTRAPLVTFVSPPSSKRNGAQYNDANLHAGLSPLGPSPTAGFYSPTAATPMKYKIHTDYGSVEYDYNGWFIFV